MANAAQFKRDLAALLASSLPEWSEFRGLGDENEGRNQIRRGRRVSVPLSTSGVLTFSGQLFTSPSTLPAPTAILRTDQYEDERDVTIYLAWDLTPNRTAPVIPVIFAMIQWGVGGVTYSRMVDVHRVPRRISLVAHWVQVTGVYLDLGESGVPASIDMMASVGSGEAENEFWTGTWFGPTVSAQQNVTAAPTVLLGASGSLVTNAGGTFPLYWMCLDIAGAPGGGEKPIAGSVSLPLTAVGDTFAFSEEPNPGVFAENGLCWVLSTDPTLNSPEGGDAGPPTAEVQVKFAMGFGT